MPPNINLANKFLCAQAAFFQPPRDNPWTGLVDPEESAYPYPNWNEKAFASCYGPLGDGPIADEAGLIAGMENLYSRIGFTFPPSLLAWLESAHPDLYALVLRGDAESVRERGFGNAVAQPYRHAVLPLQSLADKRTLVRWGLQDFEARFGRRAEGFWLPELAADEETLEVLIEARVRFVLLSPDQALRVRELGSGDEGWREVTERNLPPTRPYRWRSRAGLGSSLGVFFHHRLLSEAVSAGEALSTPQALVKKVLARYFPNDSTQLVTISTDGEAYGYRHPRGHEVLAGALQLFEEEGGRLCNLAQFHDLFPPPQEVELKAFSDRRRGPLREPLLGLAGRLDKLYEARAGRYFRDYRTAREAYGTSAGRGTQAAASFLKAHALPALPPEEAHEALELLEVQRERLALLDAACWTAAEPSSLEGSLSLSRAARACDLSARFGVDLETGFKESLGEASKAYETLAAPGRSDLSRAAARAALLEHLGLPLAAGGALRAETLSSQTLHRMGTAGRDRSLTLSRLEATDVRTLETASALAAVHQRERLDLSCWVSLGAGEAGLAEDLQGLFEARSAEGFERSATERLGVAAFGLDALYPEERKEALRLLTPFPFKTRERERFFADWREALGRLDGGAEAAERVWALLDSCPALHLRPDQLPFAGTLRSHVRRLFRRLAAGAGTPAELSLALRWLEASERTGLAVDLWELRHLFWRWRESLLAGGPRASREAARALGEKLGFSRSALLPLEGLEAAAP